MTSYSFIKWFLLLSLPLTCMIRISFTDTLSEATGPPQTSSKSRTKMSSVNGSPLYFSNTQGELHSTIGTTNLRASVSEQPISASGPSSFGPPSVPSFTDSNQSPSAHGPPSFGPPAGNPEYRTSTMAPGPPSFTDHNQVTLRPQYSSYSTVNGGFNWLQKETTHQNDMNAPSKLWIDMPNLYADEFDPVGFIKGICPFTKSCREGNEIEITEYDSCCLSCDCSDECFAKGNCCYDKEVPVNITGQKPKTTSINESCVFPTYGRSSMQELQELNKKSVLMVANCPDKEDEYNLSANQILSENPCENPKLVGIRSILDLAPVYSFDKRVSYSNRLCAECNSVTKSFVPWSRTTLTCPRISFFIQLFQLSTNIESFLLNLRLTGCTIEFHPPNNDSVQCLHEDAIISDCHEFFLQFVNPKLREYCKNVTIPFGHDGEIYKNIFCFGCNVFKQYIDAYSCKSFEFGYGFEYRHQEAEINIKAIEEGLFVDVKSQSGNELDKRCEEGYIYNQNSNQCLTHVCAPSKVNVSGKCLPVFKNLKNVGLDYKVTFRFLVGTVDSEKYLYEDKVNKMASNDSMIRICRRNIKTTASLRDYHVTYATLVSRVVTEMTNVEQEFNDFKQRYSTEVNSQEHIEANLDHDGFTILPLTRIDFVTFNDVKPGNECPESIAMVDLQFCDAVMFRINLNQRDDKGILQVNTTKFKPSEYLVRLKPVENSLIMYAQICKDLFFSKLETKQTKEDSTISSDAGLINSYSIMLMLFSIFALNIKTIHNYMIFIC